MSESVVQLSFPAKPDYLLLARLALAGVARTLELEDEEVADLKLAVTEAVANAVRHAYPEDSAGRVTVELTAAAGRLEIAVSDQGRGLRDAEVLQADGRGRGESGMGLSIIRAIADEVDVGAGPDGRGTLVRFACAL